MLNKRTVIVLGAGSSVEFGLPAGPGLAQKIAKSVDFYLDGSNLTSGDPDLWSALRGSGQEMALKYLRAGRLISQGLPLAHSIDDFLHIHGENQAVVDLGKAAICAAIVAAEAKSVLKWKHDADISASFHRLSNTWAYKLFKYIWSGIRLKDVDRLFENLSIINFNYDRCVEEFMWRAIHVAYSIREDEAARIVSTLDIIHPYGQVGRLPWQARPANSVGFGAEADRYDPLELASGIKTLTEQAHDPEDIVRWRARIAESEQVLFLGFAFHQQNVDLLTGAPSHSGPWPKAYATAFNTSAPDTLVFQERIEQIRRRPPAGYSAPAILRKTCAEFIDEYGLTISS